MNIVKTCIFSLAGLIALSGFLSAAPSRPSEPETSREVRAFETSLRHLLAMRLDRAQQGFQRVLSIDEEFAEAHVNLAFVLRKQGEDHFEQALKHYNRAIELNDELAEAFMYRGVLYFQMGKLDKALADHERLLELNEDLAAELQWVIENGKEREPEHFFGVIRTDALER